MTLLSAITPAGDGIVQKAVTGESHHLINLVLQADPVVQFTLVLLVIFSIVSWAIIFAKHRQLKVSKRQSRGFIELFWNAERMDDLAPKRRLRRGPAFQIYNVGQQSVEQHKKSARKEAKDSVERDVRRAYEEEIEQAEYGIPFLAITASAAPFIGLFGTVWGILNAFWKIGQSGSSSLALVGPHIAEALIATAIGLAAAIPAVIFYNVFVNRVRRFSKELEDFTEDLVDRVHQEHFEAAA